MREAVTEPRLRAFMRAIAAEAREPGRVYFTGGASAVLHGWRESTLDIDISIVPESDRMLRAIPDVKERLHVNVELASPADFVPPLPGWEGRVVLSSLLKARSRFITTISTRRRSRSSNVRIAKTCWMSSR